MAYHIYKPQWSEGRTVRGVLFDMDGLVLDSEILYARFWREACAFYGFTMSHEQALGMRGLNHTAGAAILREWFGPEANHPQIRAKRIELMDAFIEANGVELKPGVVQLLDYLQLRGIAAAITSASPLPRIQNHLARHGLDTRFQKLCSGHDVPRGKPEPDIYLHGAASLGLKPEECLALEDAPAGILSAYRAGCLPVMVPDLDQPTEETEALLFARADSLTDVIDLLENWE